MFETSCFHKDLDARSRRDLAGDLGKILSFEGEYSYYFGAPLGGDNPKTNKVDPEG